MIGNIKIRITEMEEPQVVYVEAGSLSGINYSCKVLNTTIECFAKKEDLIDYDFRTHEKLWIEWKIASAKRTIVNYEKELEFIRAK